jgi:hypothetical protein
VVIAVGGQRIEHCAIQPLVFSARLIRSFARVSSAATSAGSATPRVLAGDCRNEGAVSERAEVRFAISAVSDQ